MSLLQSEDQYEHTTLPMHLEKTEDGEKRSMTAATVQPLAPQCQELGGSSVFLQPAEPTYSLEVQSLDQALSWDMLAARAPPAPESQAQSPQNPAATFSKAPLPAAQGLWVLIASPLGLAGSPGQPLPTATPQPPHLLHILLHLPALMSLHFKLSDNGSTNTNAESPHPPSVPVTSSVPLALDGIPAVGLDLPLTPLAAEDSHALF